MAMSTPKSTGSKIKTQAAAQIPPKPTLSEQLRSILSGLPNIPGVAEKVMRDFIFKNAKTKEEALEIGRSNHYYPTALPACIYYGIDLDTFTDFDIANDPNDTSYMNVFKYAEGNPYFSSFTQNPGIVTKDWLKFVLIPLDNAAVFQGRRKAILAARYSFRKLQELSGNRATSPTMVDRNYTAIYERTRDPSLQVFPTFSASNPYPQFVAVLESGKAIPNSVKDLMVEIYAASLATKRTNMRHYRPMSVLSSRRFGPQDVFEVDSPAIGRVTFSHAEFLNYWQWVCELHAHISAGVSHYCDVFDEFGSPLSDEFMHFAITREIPHAFVQTVHALNSFALFDYIVNKIEVSMRVLEKMKESD